MMDVFTLPVRMPDFIMRAQPRKRTAGMAGSFLVGAASGLVIGPCTAPALAVVLGYAATRQNVAFASSLMFVFAVGMGTLLILVGTFAGFLAGIPKSGHVDGPDQPYLRLDTPRYGRVFPDQRRNALGLRR